MLPWRSRALVLIELGVAFAPAEASDSLHVRKNTVGSVVAGRLLTGASVIIMIIIERASTLEHLL